jgi:hypothetical protein
VRVEGRSEPGATVRLFASAGCGGAAVAEGRADASGAFGVQVGLAPDAVTHVSAQARDAAGNTGACSAPLALAHDGLPPPVPQWLGVTPASPSAHSTQPLLEGRAEPLSRVALFSDPACRRALPFEARADAAGAFQVPARVAPDSTGVFHARAEDAAGNASGCTPAPVVYTHDATPPAPPVLTALSPASPSREWSTLWRGAAEPHARVRVHAEADCTDAPLLEAVARADGAWGFYLAAATNAVTRRYATSTDAAGHRSACALLGAFEHDDVRPATPVLAFTPASPQRVTATPRVRASTEPGATVVLRGYRPGGWQEEVLAEGVAGPDGVAELTLAVTEGDTRLLAFATDRAGNTSFSSASYLTYTYDLTPPQAPALELLSEPMPSLSATALWVVGTAEKDARITVHADPACAGPVLGADTSTSFRGIGAAAFAVWTPLPLGREGRLYAQATDVAGHASPCTAAGLPFRLAPEGERGWSGPELLPPGTRYTLGMDASGHLYAVRAHPAGGQRRVEVLHRSAGGGEGWQELEVLASWADGSSGPIDVPPLLAVNARGDLLVHWAEPQGPGVHTPRTARYVAATGQWEAPMTPPGRPVNTALQLAADGSALLCWNDADSRRWCSHAPAGAPWGAAQQPPGEGYVRTPHAVPGGAVSLHGRLVAPYTAALVASRLTAQGVWGPEVQLAAVTRKDAAAVDAAGTLWVAYFAPEADGTLAVFARSLPTGAAAWSEPVRLQHPVALYTDLHLVASAAGEVAVGLLDEEGRLVVHQHSQGLGWSAPSAPYTPPDTLPSYANLGPFLRLAASAPGEVWVFWLYEVGPVWTHEFGGTQSTAARGARLVRGAGWGEAQTLAYERLSKTSFSAAAPLTNGAGVLAVQLEEYQRRDWLRVLR